MNPVQRKVEKALIYVLGLGGGLVCAAVATVGAFYLSRVIGYGMLWVGVAMALSVILFVALSLAAPRYFACFSATIVSGFSDGQEDDGHTVIFSILFFLAVLLLAVGAVFHVHLIFASGFIAFLAYAIFIWKEIGNTKNQY